MRKQNCIGSFVIPVHLPLEKSSEVRTTCRGGQVLVSKEGEAWFCFADMGAIIIWVLKAISYGSLNFIEGKREAGGLFLWRIKVVRGAWREGHGAGGTWRKCRGCESQKLPVSPLG